MPLSVKSLIERLQPEITMSSYGVVHTDTSDFVRISYGDVIAIGGLHYLVLRDEVERSFGVEDPKYWVKRCTVLENGERRIVKLVFHESFFTELGALSIRCYRSPEKEARILDLTRGDPRFMQGFSLRDTTGNNVRVIDVISGKPLAVVVDEMPLDHKTYFFEAFPGILEKFIEACEAIGFLHAHGEKHGDIRRDHLWLERGTGRYRWIDFDYTFDFQENPFGLDVLGLGGLLAFLVGKGFYGPREIVRMKDLPETATSLQPEDFSLVFRGRLMNLRKVFSCVPEGLNRVLLHFSQGTEVFYETVDEFLHELRPCLKELARA